MQSLQPGLSYLLILDIAPVDDLRHRWTGLTWEPDADGESPGGFRDGASTGFKINLEKTPPRLVSYCNYHLNCIRIRTFDRYVTSQLETRFK